MVSILLIDDENEWLASFKRTLLRHEIADASHIFTSSSRAAASGVLRSNRIDLVFLDLMMNGDSGEDILGYLRADYPETAVIIITGVNDIQTAVRCMKLGAVDYFNKTVFVDELMASVQRVIKICELEKENRELKRWILADNHDYTRFDSFITTNQKMLSIFQYLTAVAHSSQSILITGESGTGKGLLAKAIAEVSRPGKPFVSVNVAGLDAHMFTDTLFGHAKGAFTGADSKRTGMIQQTRDGVLFLDEIGELPIESQLKLLYVTQNGEYQALGSDAILKTGARFIFATNQDLEEKQLQGTFRKDLYYRLKTHHVHIPPLRERREDIPLLVEHFVKKSAADMSVPVPAVPDEVIHLLQTFSFPGNVRELAAMVYDAVAKFRGNALRPEDFEDGRPSRETGKTGLFDGIANELPTVDNVITELISVAMRLSGNNQSRAAALIGLSQSTLSRKLRG